MDIIEQNEGLVKMNKRARRIYFLFFVIVFLVCAPALIFYARGYRINFSEANVYRTGSLVIQTEPNQASVRINGELMKKKTNDTFEYLVPGEYSVALERDGYYIREYRVTVESGKTTFLENIALFPKNAQQAELASDVSWIASNPSNERLLLGSVSGNETTLKSIDTSRFGNNTDVSTLPSIASANVSVHAWDTKLSRAVLERQSGSNTLFDLLNIDTNTVTSVSDVFTQTITHVVFDNKDTNILYALDNTGRLLKLNLESQNAEQLLEGPWVDLALYEERLWLLNADRGVFQAHKNETANGAQEVARVADVTEHRFVTGGGVLALKTSEALEVFHSAGDTITRTTANDLPFNAHCELKNEDAILAMDAVSLLEVDITEESTSIVTRSSSTIHGAVFSSHNNAIFVSTDNGVQALDRTRVGSYDPLTIISEPLRSMSWDASNEHLFGLSQNNTLLRFSF